MTVTTAFRVDEDGDVPVLGASGRRLSRFGSYIWQHAGVLVGEVDDLTDDGDRRVAWAAAVWSTVRPPVMTPGHVRSNSRVLSDQVRRCQDGSLVATVELATPWPERLLVANAWRGNPAWQGWVTVPRPSPHPTFACARLDFPLPAVELPPAPHELADDLTEHAHAAVSALVTLLNRVVSPAIATLEGDAP